MSILQNMTFFAVNQVKMLFPHEKQIRFRFIHLFEKLFVFSLSAALADVERREEETYKCGITPTCRTTISDVLSVQEQY